MKRLKNTRGITLIALVVTIVVLLILAAVSISMLTGENGIITQAQESKEKTEQAKVEEIVDLAITTLISGNQGSTNGITPKDIADKINSEYSQYENVYAEDKNNFPTKIIFPEEGDRKVEVDLNKNTGEENTGDSDKIYNADVSEEDIEQVVDIFEYEIINDAETGATSLDSLPTKEARITRIKPEYCNAVEGGYISDTGEKYENTNYEIVLENENKITDTLVVPYQVEIGGEMYKITEARIACYWSNTNNTQGYIWPNVKTIILPNTIRVIDSTGFKGNSIPSSSVEKIVLSQNITSIPSYIFYGCSSLQSIEIPSKVTSIGEFSVYGCWSLTTVNYEGKMSEWQQISGKDSLYNVQIICEDGTINQ